MRNIWGAIWGIGCIIFLISWIDPVITGKIAQETISYNIGFILGTIIIFTNIKKER